ncbi:MAG TPA: hypothetical protein VFI24_26035 [Pyrinomonadaceae bacterium]|nr:hypothetical protein [Pyrinomonadaceae bacterium]
MNHEYINEFHLIDQYVLGKLGAAEAEEFENHFIDCPECVEQLQITRSFIGDLKDVAIQETLVSSKKPAPVAPRWGLERLVPRYYRAAIACGCVLLVGVFAFFGVRRLNRLEAELRQAREETSTINQQYQRGVETAAASEKEHQEAKQQLTQRLEELEKKLKTEGATNQPGRGSDAPEVNFPIYALASVRGNAPAPVEITLSASNSGFALSIPVEDTRVFTSYRVTIIDQQGKTVWQQGGFRPDAYHALSLSLNSKFLGPGSYDLRVEGFTAPNQWDAVGNYPFRIVRRR